MHKIIRKQKQMANIHLILQGKGGVGKSMIAALFAQYRLEKNPTISCVDTDPVNSSFKAYSALDVISLNIMNGTDIEPRNFDKLIELFVQHSTADVDFIVDSGASSFVALSNYIINNNLTKILKDMGYNLVLHTVVTSGQAFDDTLMGFAALVRSFPKNADFVVWLNPQFGPVRAYDIDGDKNFTELSIYREYAHKVNTLISLPELADGTFKTDFSHMLQRRETFNQSLANPAVSFMERHRLQTIKEMIWQTLDDVNIIQ